jgi:predicted NAD/FAD-binding protein
MHIRLRTLIYSDRLEIENVPVFSCDACNYNELYAEAKPDLTKLIDQLGGKPEKQQLYFNEINDFAHMLFTVSAAESLPVSAEKLLEERVNRLLDLLLLAKSLNDELWERDICGRLEQIVQQTEPIHH